MNILGLSHNPSLLNVILISHAVSYPLLESQVAPALICFCDAGGKGERGQEAGPNNQQGVSPLHCQGSQSQGGLEFTHEDRGTKWSLIMIFN